MVRKKKDEPERTCATCGRGPDKDKCMDGEDCSRGGLWFPKEETKVDHKAHGERLSKGLDAIKERHDNLPGDCKISVNGGPAVPFPSAEATEQVTEMVEKHLEDQGVKPKVIDRRFIGKHILEEFEDGTVSFDGGPRVTKADMKEVVDLVQVIKGDKKPTQLDLEGKPLPEPEVEDDDETEVREFTIYRSNGLVFRIGTEALGKALEMKKKEGVNDRKDRIKLLVQNRSKVNSGKPLDPDRWDAGTKAIYERIMVGHGREP